MKRAGAALLIAIAALTIAAPWLAPNPPNRRFSDLMYAPPTRVYLFQDAGQGRRPPSPGGGLGAPGKAAPTSAAPTSAAPTSAPSTNVSGPHIYPWRLVNRLERRFEEDRPRPLPLRWFAGGHLVSGDADSGAPLLLLGADGYGRDIFSRLLYGARATLTLAALATLAATLLGAVIGGVAGHAGGWLDAGLSRVSEFVLVLPTIYVALALRAVMPLVLPAAMVFVVLLGIFTLLGWPVVARGVRAIILAERERDYVTAARASGAGGVRLIARHLLPAARGYITTQATLLLPAFILAEATLSFVGLGFPDSTPTWGTMLQDASNVALLGDAPWTLAPAAAIFLVVLGVNLVVQGGPKAPPLHQL